MGIEFKKKAVAGRFPEIWRGECKVLPGGFKPIGNYPVGTVIRRGAPLYVDFATRNAAVCKTAVVVNGGTTTAPRVAKGHYFAPGDSVAVSGGATAVSVVSVTTDNEGYDVITFNKALTGVKADDILINAADEAVDGKFAPKYAPNMIVSADKEFKGHGIDTLDAGYDAMVITPSLASTPMLDEWLSGIFLKQNPNIMFITQ
ncbi:MAG: hypothetical protein NC401_12170 [Ruminococcus sp.]|nr:hypothetical protein [Ruminococcus sp.]MCM1439017.1 hypothetical protein [Roseburia sp.]